jgi:hypothetical protein
MSQTVLVSLDKGELKQLIKECLKEASMMPDVDEEKLTQLEAAIYLEISETTLISWKKKGIVPYYQFPRTKRVYYLKSELRRSAARNSRRSED